MNTFTFEQRVAQINQQIQSSEPAIAVEIQHSVSRDIAEWEREPFRATLTLHQIEALPRLSLQLYNGEDQHPAPLQIGFYGQTWST